jgi:DmsE family decaheme c-type cytochrome
MEGKLTCASCHDPHGSPSQSLLRATDVNQLCYQCHAEKRGPFIYEHAPVRDSCLNCHLPHGSNHERLLRSSLPMLCQQCHVQQTRANHGTALMTRGNLPQGSLPDERIMNRGCVNCHLQVRGSNHPSGPRLHR